MFYLTIWHRRKVKKSLVINSYTGITVEDNISAFDVLVEKMQSSPFKVFFHKIGTKVANGRDKFISLSVDEQTTALFYILMLLKTGRSTGCDLTLINESGQAGVLTLNSDFSKIKDKKTIYIIDQSPTGLIERKSLNLLDL